MMNDVFWFIVFISGIPEGFFDNPKGNFSIKMGLNTRYYKL